MQQLQIPPLAEGEIYVGCIGDAAGNLHHVILLPGDNDDATHEAQIEWAKSIGGDLPNRIEQAMLWANHRDQFKKDWYWSNETHQSESSWAWSRPARGTSEGVRPAASAWQQCSTRACSSRP